MAMNAQLALKFNAQLDSTPQVKSTIVLLAHQDITVPQQELAHLQLAQGVNFQTKGKIVALVAPLTIPQQVDKQVAHLFHQVSI